MWHLLGVAEGDLPRTSDALVMLSGCSRKVYPRAHCPFLWESLQVVVRRNKQPNRGQLSQLLPLLNPSHKPDSVAATMHQQHYFTRCITTEAITLTGFPNSNSEKNLYQGSFFKSISSGLISRLYKGWWQGNGRKRRITLCKRLHRNRPVEMQRLWVPQHPLQQQWSSSVTDTSKDRALKLREWTWS